MRIGFVLDESVRIGGGFQQSLSTILALKGLREHEIVILTQRSENLKVLANAGLECHRYRFPFYSRWISNFLKRNARAGNIFKVLPTGLTRIFGPFDRLMDHHRIDLLICFFLSPIPLYIHHRPFIATVYDLCHREHCEFPEVSEIWEFEHRERIFRETLPRAVAVLASSPALAKSISRYYAVDPTRIAIIPFLPALHSRKPASTTEVQRIRAKYGLLREFVYYPAQFWAHKNHVYVLEGLKNLEEEFGIRMDAAFSGSDFGNQAYVKSVADRLGLTERVHFLGFVPSEDVNALYTGARALVMPTYFGPTNVPPLEAIALGRPVVYSDFPEFRVEMGEAAYYCDLKSPRSLAHRLNEILEGVRDVPGPSATELSAASSASEHNYVEAFQKLLDDFVYLRRRWQL